jgi:uncharacterized protein
MVATTQSNLPDYGQLVKFLFQPFLSTTEPIGVDCEYTLDRHRVWIRVAVASSDQGSAFGRGGRNIQAIRTVLQAAATAVGQSIHLDVYGSNSSSRERDSDRTTRDDEPANPGRSAGSRPTRSAPNRRPANGEDRPNGGDSPSNIPPPRPRR